MRLPALALVVLAAGCGSSSPSPSGVVREWSTALNRGENEHAASLFATNARVVQGGTVLVLRTRAAAVAWNSRLPCAGRITKLVASGETVTATFVLGERPGHSCDGPGHEAGAVLEVHRGKITLWPQTGTGPGAPAGSLV